MVRYQKPTKNQKSYFYHSYQFGYKFNNFYIQKLQQTLSLKSLQTEDSINSVSLKSISSSSTCKDDDQFEEKLEREEKESRDLINAEKIKEGHLSINYNFLLKVYSELSSDQKIKFTKNLESVSNKVAKTG